MNNKNAYQRDSQFELLRIIAMFCILYGHVKSHFMGDFVDYHNIYISLLMPIICVHVLKLDKCRMSLFNPLDKFVLNKIEQSRFRGIFKI